MIGMIEKKKCQSSVIVPRNEIDSHPAEREITLADDTAVTLPGTHHDSNMNNLHQARPYTQPVWWGEEKGGRGVIQTW